MFHFAQFSGGVHPLGNKNTHFNPVVRLDNFKEIRIPMSMHIGPPCTCVVKKGDSVKVGQMIGQPDAPLAVPIHASVSGTVQSVRKELASSGRSMEVVTIESDGQYTKDDSLAVPNVTDRTSFIQAVRNSGLVGLGGTGFPTHMKMKPPPGKEPDTLVINAAECEPYITSDFRQCVEHPDQIIDGILAVLKYIDIPRALVGVEDNKPKAVDALRNELAKRNLDASSDPAITIQPLKTRYPQGAEKMLIYSLTKRVVPTGGLPHDVHVLVLNVNTVRFIAEYLETGVPLVRKQLTLDGSAIRVPGNFDVPIGAPIPDVVEAAGGLKSDPAKVIMGGPMMGVALDRVEATVIKHNNAILVFDAAEAAIPDETQCIRCGRCVDACPMLLMPTDLDSLARFKDVEGLQRYHVMDCIECGCCTYVCPAKRYLVQSIRLGKTYVQDAKKKGAAQS